ncbi:hypothetical protein VCRA2110O2_30052 [Vibrio crassostreae]|nr:hypothetical protein VCRA2110O2_30052 [Vibrio crassostreae]
MFQQTKKAGVHIQVALRTNGYFNMNTSKETVQGIEHKHGHLMLSSDGYKDNK